MKEFWVLCLAIWAISSSESASSSNSDSSSTSSSEEQKNGYIFTAPRSMSTGATNQIQLRRYGNLDAGEFTVTVLCQETYNGNESTAVEKTYEIEKDQDVSYLDLPIPNFDNYVYNGRIAIKGTFGDYNIAGSDKVYFSRSKDTLIVIQTDKPIYKEGQTVKFRVLKVNKHLKPADDEKINIYVEDPKGIRLFQWNDMTLENGLTQQEFLLSNEPERGTWKISVTHKDEINSETFEVAEYRLPKFEVTIQKPPFILINAEEIKVTVCAKYTYGKPVEGIARLNISLETYQWSGEKLPVIEYEQKIKGCFDYPINVSLVETEDYYRFRSLVVKASVVEEGTGVERNVTEFLPRQYSPLLLAFNDEQRQFFKPGLPYNGKLIVTYPDNTPAEGEDIKICYSVTRERLIMNWSATKKEKFCKNYTSDAYGTIEYIIPPQNTDATGITIEAKSLKYVRDSKANNRQSSLSQPQTSMSITPYYSPSGSFIQLQPVQETLFCGTERKLKLLFTSKSNDDFTFYYEVLSQGEVKHRGTVEKSFSVDDDVSNQFEDEDKLVNDEKTVIVPSATQYSHQTSSESGSNEEEDCPSAKETRYVPPVGEAFLEIPVGYNPSSYLHVVVWYARKDREIVADSQKLKIEKCFKNQVQLEFGDAEKQPGTKTTMKITASPNSLCGIKVVDKSVSLLNSNEQLSRDKIFNLLDGLDHSMYYGVNYCNEDVPQPGLYRASSPGIVMPPRPWSSSYYEDSIAAFNNAGMLVISDEILLTRPCKNKGGGGNGYTAYEDSSVRGGAAYSRKKPIKKVAMASTARRPAAPSAVNAPPPPNEQMGFAATKSVAEVRTKFPETWLFELEMTGDDGTYVEKERLPDTITQWDGDAFCINKEDGLGISNKTSIKGFQAFFISMNLPYSVIRGEKFWMIVSIFNYVQDSLPITVTLEKFDGFEITDGSIDGDICIEPDSNKVLKIQLKAISLGEQNITVRAETAESKENCGSSNNQVVAKDAMRESIIVEAEGWKRQKIMNTLSCPKDDENEVFKKTYSFDIPEDAVEGSAREIFDVTGNVFGKPLDNLNNLITLPTGCGEQNMVKFAPNVAAIKFLTEANQLDEKSRNKIIKNLNTGVQNEMQYKHSDGSFSAFGPVDKEGSMFLTAFVLRYFAEASKFTTIDKGLLLGMQHYIVSKQQENGCFPNTGKVIVRGIQGGLEKEKSDGRLTAYVLSALSISEFQNQTVIDSALSCMTDNEDSTFYTAFLYAFAEALAGQKDLAKERISQAREKSVVKDGMEYFPDANATMSEKIETASYAVLGMLLVGYNPSEVLPIIRYLTSNMNQYGGFYSTQDTCVGVEALGAFATRTVKDPVDMNVQITGAIQENLEINQDNKLVVQRRLISDPSDVNVEATGTGCALIQAELRYNSIIAPEERYFDLSATGRCEGGDSCLRATITVATSYLAAGKRTGMAIIEVHMISGMSPDRESVDKLKEDETLQVMRADVENNVLTLYFNEITNEQKKFSFIALQIAKVDDYQPGKVKVYDYYNTDISTSTTYVLECDGASCPQPKDI